MNARLEQLCCSVLAALFCFSVSPAASALPVKPDLQAAPGYVVDVRKGGARGGFRAVPGRRFDGGGPRYGGGQRIAPRLNHRRFKSSPALRSDRFKHRRYRDRGPGFRKIPRRRRHGGPFVPYYYLPIDPYVNDYSYYYDSEAVHPCRWLLRNAQRTGKRYWWRRYKRCVAKYD